MTMCLVSCPGCRLSVRPSADNARLLVAWLRQHAQPAVDDAVQTILARFPHAEVQVDMCRVAQLAPQTRPSSSQGIYAGNVWVNAGGTITQIAIRARFDGRVDWYWVRQGWHLALPA